MRKHTSGNERNIKRGGVGFFPVAAATDRRGEQCPNGRSRTRARMVSGKTAISVRRRSGAYRYDVHKNFGISYSSPNIYTVLYSIFFGFFLES